MSTINQGFQACLFDPDRGSEVVEGTLFVDRWKVRFQSETVSHEIPTDAVELDLEEDGERVYFRDPDNPELALFTPDRSILDLPQFRSVNALRSQVGNISGRRELKRALRLTGYFAAGCLLVFWIGSLAMHLAVRSLAAKVPEQWEQSFGASEISKLQEDGELLNDSNDVAELAEMAQPLLRVIPGMTNQVRFYISDDDEPNAFALPGGYVVVNRGLLQMADTPEELLGVLAHELAHVSKRHIVRSVISSAGPLVIFGVLFHSRDGVLNLLSAGSGLMVVKGFSQEFETEADETGWNYLVAANIDPRGMITVFRKLKAYEDAQLNSGLELPRAFQSHPALEKRVARLEKNWKSLPKKSGFLQLTNAIPKPPVDEKKEKMLKLFKH